MSDYNPRREAGIDDVDSIPKFTATGDRSVRARGVNKRHIKILDDLQTELGDVGRREAIAALAEYYHSHPEEVIEEVTGPGFR